MSLSLYAATIPSCRQILAAVAALLVKPQNHCAEHGMRFSFGERHMDFTAEDFLQSFSQPNFYFHATTAYDILRWQGLTTGKRDFMGRVRLKQ
jgi:hypothetical protein